MPTRNVNLSEQQAKFIRRSIDRGGYQNASEVVRAGLRLLQQEQQQDELKLRALRRLTANAFRELDQGKFDTVGPDGLDAFLSKLEARARKSNSR